MKKYTSLLSVPLLSIFLYGSLMAGEQLETSQPKNPQENNWATFWGHGLGGVPAGIHDYIDAKYIMPGTGIAENMHGAESEISFGQDHEMGYLKKMITLILNAFADQKPKIVAQGTSMGSSAILNLVGTHPELAAINLKRTDPNAPIHGIIAESPFASTEDVLKDIVKHNMFFRIVNFFVPSLKYYVLKWLYPNHDIHGIQPIEAIKNIWIPILLFGSKEDDLTRYQHIRRLYKTARESGNSTCHYFEVQHGKHANICFEKKDDTGFKILCVVHAFRKRYNLGNYSEKLAQAGWKNFMHNTQPVFE